MINSCVAVVDAKKARVYRKNFGEFYVNQIESADCVVLSRSQDVSEERLKEVLDMVRELNAEATVVAAPWDTLTGADLLSAIENRDSLKASMEALKAEHHHHDEDECDDPECECHHHHDDDDDEHEHHHHHHHHHGHDADEVFASWGFETMHKFTEDELKEKIAALDDEAKFGAVLRAKGVLPAADGERWIHFDHVPGEVEIRRGPAGVIGRLCVIGSKINEDALKALFGE